MSAFWLWLCACRGGDAPSPTPPITETGPPGPTGDTAEPWPEVRCAELRPLPLTATVHPTARAEHDVIFDDAGHLIGSHDGGLWRFPASGPGALFAVGIGGIFQMDWLPTGALAVMAADSGYLERVDPETGARFGLTEGGYAVRAGPAGFLWTSDAETLTRLSPGTWARDTVIESLPDGMPKVVAFDRDRTRAWVGTGWGTGVVYQLGLDATGAPTGPATVFATAVGGGWHDAIGVDACGGVWVTDAVTSGLYRIDPDGNVALALDFAPEDHAHGLRWGSGGAWREDALYVAQPYHDDQVSEIVVGIPSADWRGGRYVVVP